MTTAFIIEQLISPKMFPRLMRLIFWPSDFVLWGCPYCDAINRYGVKDDDPTPYCQRCGRDLRAVDAATFDKWYKEKHMDAQPDGGGEDAATAGKQP